MVVFQYEGVWIGFANVFNPMSYYNGKGMPPYDSVGATPVGTVNTVLTWSPECAPSLPPSAPLIPSLLLFSTDSLVSLPKRLLAWVWLTFHWLWSGGWQRAQLAVHPARQILRAARLHSARRLRLL